ncbi:MAG: zinc dependent phospholipase C family protein [Deltaproteobacteria bacterium]|nr:zinc dependent phospholipase C family protein [Candidatus Tharpellaceae bacterium]
MLIVFFSLLFVLLSCGCASAWGPATHLELARELLASKDLLPLQVAAALACYPYDFLYGNIAADMVVGKKFVDPLRHCHTWPVAFELQDRICSPAQQAFVYGYLAHLAADIVAHNSFVPSKIVQYYHKKGALHLYWEMRFEVSVRHKLWKYAHLISRRSRWENDPLLARAITPTLFSFSVNRRIFNTVLLLNRTRRWQRLLARLDQSHHYVLSGDEILYFKAKSLANMLEILRNLKESPLCVEDPRGERNLARAKKIGRRLRRTRSSSLISGQLQEYVQLFIS